jgi:type I restriction enzyme, S subunit
MKLVQLSDIIFKVQTWNPIRDGHNALIDYIDLSSVDQDSKTIQPNEPILAGEAPSRARQLIKSGDVLVSTVRPNLNAVAMVNEDLDGATASTGFCVLRSNPEKIDRSYLFQWVKTSTFVSDMVRKATGASYPAVSDRIILESQIPLPPIAQQKHIAAILDQAEALRSARRKAIGLLDELARSVFLEMFGDPVTNPKGWNIRKLADFVDEFRYGSSNKSQATGKPILRIPNVIGGTLNLTELKTVPVDDAEFERLKMQDGDILFVRTNGNPDFVGRCAVFERRLVVNTGFSEDEFVFASYLIRARISSKLIDTTFLREFLLGSSGRQQLRSSCKTSAGQFNINIPSLSAVFFPLPPLALQQEFADRIGAIEALKAQHRESLTKLDALFASLQHRAFRGEL